MSKVTQFSPHSNACLERSRRRRDKQFRFFLKLFSWKFLTLSLCKDFEQRNCSLKHILVTFCRNSKSTQFGIFTQKVDFYPSQTFETARNALKVLWYSWTKFLFHFTIFFKMYFFNSLRHQYCKWAKKKNGVLACVFLRYASIKEGGKGRKYRVLSNIC